MVVQMFEIFQSKYNHMYAFLIQFNSFKLVNADLEKVPGICIQMHKLLNYDHSKDRSAKDT